jgi:hypothetical protein
MRVFKGMIYFFSIIGLVVLFACFIFELVFFREELKTGRIIRIGRRIYGVVAREL